jgi:hypothetical protein
MKSIFLSILLLVFITSCVTKSKHRKPVVYLYPSQVTDVKVKVNYDGAFTVTYPEYKNEWNVLHFLMEN